MRMRRTGTWFAAIAVGWAGSVACLAQAPATSSPASAPVQRSTPASGATRRPTAEEIRALILGAIAMKNDPNRAQAMMVRASELVPHLRPDSNFTALIVEFTPDKGQLDHLLRPTSQKVLEEKKKLSAHMELVEKYLSSTYPFTGMADNGKGVIFPKPVTDKVLQEQAILRDGNTVFSVVTDPRKETRWKKYHVSPDEKFIVMQDWLRAKPTEVMSIDTGKSVTVEAPEIEGHDYVYPFRFLKWGKDSKSFTVEVGGTHSKGTGQFMAYREIWQVQADTGKASRAKRQEQPWAEKLKWEDD